jgi:hypothetical protein
VYLSEIDKEASPSRDCCVAVFLNKNNAPHRAARLDRSLRKRRLLEITSDFFVKTMLEE